LNVVDRVFQDMCGTNLKCVTENADETICTC